MKKIPKHFLEWLRIWGWMGDGWDMEMWKIRGIERIAWRAYRRGVADTKKKHGIGRHDNGR